MLGFRSHMLSEAKVSYRNFPKMVDLIIKILERRTGNKFYRFNGPNGMTLTKRGTGILYFYGNGKAIRFNHRGNDFESITLWNKFKLSKAGDLTVNLGDMNIVTSLERIVSIILNPKPGKVEFYSESYNKRTNRLTLVEAKRIKPIDFYELAKNKFGMTGDRINLVKWDQISDLGVENDVQIPTVIRKMSVKTSSGVMYDLNKILELPDKVKGEPAKDVEQISTIEIISGDNNTDTENMIPQQKRKVRDAVSKAKQVINNPSTEQTEDLMKKVDSLYFNMTELIKLVVGGFRNSLIIVGGAGGGKTFTVLKTIKDQGMVRDKDWFQIKGRITTAALYQMLFLHREGGLLVFDDTDDVWKDLETANILKAALDSDEPRTLSWYSGRTVNISKMSKNEKEEFYQNLDAQILTDPSSPKIKYPSEFVYKGRIIFISNLPISKMDKAVLNRSLKIDMTITPEELFARIESILPFLGDPELPIRDKKVILEAIKELYYADELGSEPSIRTFVLAEPIFKSGSPIWKELLKFS